jgi:hypothetical protein
MVQRLFRSLALFATVSGGATAVSVEMNAIPDDRTESRDGEEEGDELERWSPEVQRGFAVGLRTFLERSSSFDRTLIVTSLAVSPRETVRLSLARALDSSFEAVGVRTAIAHLAGDPSRDVRAAARRAGAKRATVL